MSKNLQSDKQNYIKITCLIKPNESWNDYNNEHIRVRAEKKMRISEINQHKSTFSRLRLAEHAVTTDVSSIL